MFCNGSGRGCREFEHFICARSTHSGESPAEHTCRSHVASRKLARAGSAPTSRFYRFLATTMSTYSAMLPSRGRACLYFVGIFLFQSLVWSGHVVVKSWPCTPAVFGYGTVFSSRNACVFNFGPSVESGLNQLTIMSCKILAKNHLNCKNNRNHLNPAVLSWTCRQFDARKE